MLRPTKGAGYGKAGTGGESVTGRQAVLPGMALGCRGLTLIEVLVTTVLLSLILGAAYFVLDSIMPNWKKGDEQIDVQQNLRLVMDRLTRELRASAGIEEIAPQSHIIFKSPDSSLFVKYYLYGNEIKRATSTNKTYWAGNNPVASRIKSVEFRTVDGFPATVEIKLTGTNNFVLASRVTVRMMQK